jgi:hypothetical protein
LKGAIAMPWRAVRKALVRAFVIPVAALYFLAEEYIWVHLERALAALARLGWVAWLEARVAGVGPYTAMVLFLFPLGVTWAIKIFAIYLLGTGHITALATIVAAKIVGTAIAARLFTLTRPALLSVAWFARCHAWVIRTKDWLYARVKAMPAYVAARRLARAAKATVRRTSGAIRGVLARRAGHGFFARYARLARARRRRAP